MARNKWNDFQRANAGQGLSRQQMSAAYRASKSHSAACNSRPSAANSPYIWTPTPVAPTVNYPPTPSRTASPWNAFQQQVAGLGFSREEVSEMYHAAKHIGQEWFAASSTRPAAATSTPSASSWTAYQAAPSAPAATPSPGRTQAPATNAPQTSDSAQGRDEETGVSQAERSPDGSSAMTWNQFQRQHAGQGLSKRQLSLLFNHAKASLSSSASQEPSDFREFQKQYKMDYPTEKLSVTQLARICRQQQHEDHSRCDWSDAMDELRKRLSQQLGDLMLEIAMRQQKLRRQNSTAEELNELVQAAKYLEEEECNLNRKAYVATHEELLMGAMSPGEQQQHHELYVMGLEQCEVIDLSRLEMTTEDTNRIGSGALGTVYHGVLDSRLAVAVKVVESVNANAKVRLEQELLVMMRASAHENVLRVYGYNQLTGAKDVNWYGVVMQLMAGGDLAFALHRDHSVSLSKSDRLDLLLQVIKSIEFLHSQGITHRDIKPQNVLLSSDCKTAKLADFGLAGVKNTTLSTHQSHVAEGRGAHGVMGLTPA